MSAPISTSGFASEAYVSLSPSSPITLRTVTYGPIAPDEIVVHISAVAICATDIKAAAGKFLCGPPLILGHESSGRVLEVGSEVHDLVPGDKVALSYASCRDCDECLSGGNAYCQKLAEYNFSGRRADGRCAATGKLETGDLLSEGEERKSEMEIKGHFFGQSSMGRRIVARANCAVKMPNDTTDEELRLFAALGCGIQTGVGAILNVAKPKTGSSICIFGAGSVGLAACFAAALTFPSKLVVVDNSPVKLGMLPESVKTVVSDLVDSSTAIRGEEELVATLKALSPGGHGFDFVFDCVGRGDLVKAGHLVLRSRGTVISVAGSTDMALQVTLSQHLGRGITYRGTHQGDSVPSVSIPLMIDLWRQGNFPFDHLVRFYEFDELHEAWQDLKAGKVIKPVLVNMG